MKTSQNWTCCSLITCKITQPSFSVSIFMLFMLQRLHSSVKHETESRQNPPHHPRDDLNACSYKRFLLSSKTTGKHADKSIPTSGTVTWVELAATEMQSMKPCLRVKKATICCQREGSLRNSSVEPFFAHCLCFGPTAPWLELVLPRLARE